MPDINSTYVPKNTKYIIETIGKRTGKTLKIIYVLRIYNNFGKHSYFLNENKQLSLEKTKAKFLCNLPYEAKDDMALPRCWEEL